MLWPIREERMGWVYFLLCLEEKTTISRTLENSIGICKLTSENRFYGL